MKDRKEELAGGGAGGLEKRVIGLGRRGLGRAEIAAALDVEIAELEAWEREDFGLAAALRRAADLERAWWEAQPREALAAGARANMSAWLGAMRWRFGEARAGPARGAAAQAAGHAAGPGRQEAIFYLPLHRRQRRNGKRISGEEQRALEIAHVQTFIDDGEAQLRRAQAEVAQAEAWLARLRADLAATEARQPGEDEVDEADWEDEDDWDEDDRDENDRDDAHGNDDDEGDGDDDEGDDDVGHDDDQDDGGPCGGPCGDPCRDPSGDPCAAPLSGLRAGCEWPLPAGGAGADAGAAQPDLGTGGALHAEALRDAPG